MFWAGNDPSDAPVVWDADRLRSPHGQADKAIRVRHMFDAIAPTYERVNRLASVGRDAYWRREMVRLAEVRPEDIMLDVACGTGDVVRAFAGAPIRPARILGLDFAPLMLRQAVGRPVLGGSFACGDALRLPVADGAVSLVTCAFGIRNFENLGTGLNEMHRVLMPGGRVVIIEFSIPTRRWLRSLYLLYFNRVMPTFARLVSRDRSGAYRYLPRSVLSFFGSEAIRSALASAGFSEVAVCPRTCGIVTVYVARKASRERVGRNP